MNKKSKIIMMIFCALLTMAGMGIYFQSTSQNLVVADEAAKPRVINLNAPEGSAKNPFTIVEIVAYKGMGTLGYLVEGEEPVDLREFCRTDTSLSPNVGNIGELAFLGVQETGNMPISYDKSGEKWSYTGEDGNTYQCEGRIVNKNLFRYQVLKPALGLTDKQAENYKVEVITLTPDELNQEIEKESNYIDQANMIFIGAKPGNTGYLALYEKYTKEGRAEEVKYAGALCMPDFYQAYQSSHISGGWVYPDQPIDNDISWAAALELFKRIGVEKVPLIMDYGYVSELKNYTGKSYGYSVTNPKGTREGSSNNMYKLSLLLNQMDAELFYKKIIQENYLSNQKITDIPTGFEKITGYFHKDKKPNQSNLNTVYWNDLTFLVAPSDAVIKNKEPHKISDSVHDNIFNYNTSVDHFGKTIDQDKFGDNENYKEAIDYLVEQSGGTRPSQISTLDIMQYLLKGPLYGGKEIIRILDIEPSKKIRSTTAEAAFMKERKEHFLQYFPGLEEEKLIITLQTSSEFNGKIEDLNSTYDMIYLGLDQDGLRLEGGVTKYNDSKLNGKIYLHVGDIMNGKSFDMNWLTEKPEKDDTSRFSGNDITKLRQGALEEFLEAGYPILVEARLYNKDVDLIDKTSNIYKFVEKAGNSSKLISEADPTVKVKLKKGISILKPKLELIESPQLYGYSGTNAEGALVNPKYLEKANFDFKFSITDGIGTEKYRARIYVDLNADGRFSSDEIYSDKTEEYLADGSEYTLNNDLNKDFLGAIPWKFEVYKKADKNDPGRVRASVTGLSAVQRKESEKEPIRILQITQNSGGKFPSTLNLQQAAATAGNPFQKYTKELNDYVITFETIEIKSFEARFASGGKFDNTDTMSKIKTDQLVNNYEMLIFGFADYYGDISNTNGALDNVVYFIDLGKSVLFTHDVTSFNNKTVGTEGYIFNKMFRGILGMDRFNARGGVPADLVDVATNPKGADYKEIHGYTYSALRRIGGANNVIGQKLPFNTETGFVQEIGSTNRVTRLNRGQITDYPYSIHEILPVAETHGQYYQLNLEDPEIVTWYCLADNSGGTQLYNLSPNDAANNYYIYNKKNITYSGVGHSTISGDEEAQLFINTMIAAYKSANAAPKAILTDREAAPKDGNDWYCFFNQDEENRESGTASRGDIWVEMKVVDTSLAADDYKMFVRLDVGETTEKELEIYDSKKKKITEKTKSKDGTMDLFKVKRETYYFKYNLDDYYTKNSYQEALIYVENASGMLGTTKVTFVERQLFNLN